MAKRGARQKPIVNKGKFGRLDGALYTEIIKYSDLLKRAELRNKMFIKKLEESDK